MGAVHENLRPVNPRSRALCGRQTHQLWINMRADLGVKERSRCHNRRASFFIADLMEKWLFAQKGFQGFSCFPSMPLLIFAN